MSRILLGLVLLSTLTLVGCGGLQQLSGVYGSSGGAIFSNINYPSLLNPTMEHEITIERKDLEILGPVTSQACSYQVLGFFGTGNAGYEMLLQAARDKGADGVMNVAVDTKLDYYVFGAYSKVTTTLYGTAYKYK